MTEYASLLDGLPRRNVPVVLFVLAGLLSIILILGAIYSTKEANIAAAGVVNFSSDEALHSDSSDYSENVKKYLEKMKTSGFENDTQHLRPFLSMSSKYVGAPMYDIASCSIEKSMSTVMQRVMCYVFDRETWDKINPRFGKMEWNNRFCFDKNEYINTSRKLTSFSKDHETIFITRDPIARFMSGFIDKCVNEKAPCYDCKEDVLCVVEKFYNETRRIVNQYEEAKKNGTVPWMTYHGSHFAPQTWHCDLFDYYLSYRFVKYEEDLVGQLQTTQNIIKVLEDHGVPEDMLKYLISGMNAPTKHVTKASKVRQDHEDKLRNSSKHMKLLNDIYYYDFLIFGFTPPVDNI